MGPGSEAGTTMDGDVIFKQLGLSTPPPGLAFGEPDDRLRRGIQYAAAYRFYPQRLWNTGSSAFADDDA